MRSMEITRANVMEAPVVAGGTSSFSTLRTRAAIGFATAASLVGAYELANSNNASAATLSAEKIEQRSNKCGPEATSVAALGVTFKKLGITKQVEKLHGINPVDETLDEYMKNHVSLAYLSRPAEVGNNGCLPGQLIDAGVKKLPKNTREFVDIDAIKSKYEDYSLTPKNGWKQVEVLTHEFAGGSCRNPRTGDVWVKVWVPTQKSVVIIQGKKGDTGPQGPQGPKGDTGPQGKPGKPAPLAVMVPSINKVPSIVCDDKSVLNGSRITVPGKIVYGATKKELQTNAAKYEKTERSLLSQKVAKAVVALQAKCAPKKPEAPATAADSHAVNLLKLVNDAKYSVNYEGYKTHFRILAIIGGKTVLLCNQVTAKFNRNESIKCDDSGQPIEMKFAVGSEIILKEVEGDLNALVLKSEGDTHYVIPKTDGNVASDLVIINRPAGKTTSSTPPTPVTPTVTPAPKTNVPAPVGAPGGTTAPGAPNSSNRATTDPK